LRSTDKTPSDSKVEPAPQGAGDASLDSAQGLPRKPLWHYGGEYGVIVALFVMIAVFTYLRPHSFGTTDNVKAILTQWAPVAIMAYGATVLRVMDDFDLSLVGVIALTSGVMITLMAHSGVPVILALLIVFLLAIALGAVNGFLTAGLGVSSFVITLASGQVFTGIGLMVTGGETIYSGIPAGFLNISVGKVLGIQGSVWIAIGLFVFFFLMLDYSQIGRYMYAIGGNKEAARLSGIPVRWIRGLGFVIAACCATVTAVILTGQANAYSPELGVSYLLVPYSAVFLGAAVFRPGIPNVPGTLVGALFLQIIQTGLTTLRLESAIILVVQGAVLAASVVLSVVLSRHRSA
jgi:ribose transport system permease protein